MGWCSLISRVLLCHRTHLINQFQWSSKNFSYQNNVNCFFFQKKYFITLVHKIIVIANNYKKCTTCEIVEVIIFSIQFPKLYEFLTTKFLFKFENSLNICRNCWWVFTIHKLYSGIFLRKYFTKSLHSCQIYTFNLRHSTWLHSVHFALLESPLVLCFPSVCTPSEKIFLLSVGSAKKSGSCIPLVSSSFKNTNTSDEQTNNINSRPNWKSPSTDWETRI